MDYAQLVKAIDSASRQLLGRAAAVVNQCLVIRNWLIGAYLVEFEQHGKDRARYGARLLETLSADLAARDIQGLSPTNLKQCRQLYLAYPQIRQTVSDLLSEFGRGGPIRQALSGESSLEAVTPNPPVGAATLISPLASSVLLRLSWSHLIELMRLDDPLKRAFYENQCLQGNWSVRQLQRQIGSLLYERTGLSTNKAAVIRRAHGQEPRVTIEDLIRDPYVLEFTGLAQRSEYTESGNFYLNWWKQNVTTADEQPPVGILLCSDRDHAKVEYATAGMDNKLFVSRYLVVLPSEEQLRRFLETDRARTEALIEQGRSTPRRGRRRGKSRPS